MRRACWCGKVWVVGCAGGRGDSSLDVTTVGSQVQPVEEEHRPPFHIISDAFSFVKSPDNVSVSLWGTFWRELITSQPLCQQSHDHDLSLPHACRFRKEPVAIPAKSMMWVEFENRFEESEYSFMVTVELFKVELYFFLSVSCIFGVSQLTANSLCEGSDSEAWLPAAKIFLVSQNNCF